MFGTTALPLPSTFSNDTRPLRISLDTGRPQPKGGCKYILLHPSAQNQCCSCQSFHHNRSAPGNICDCGHQACYHVHEPQVPEKIKPVEPNVAHTYTLLVDKIKHLEEALLEERKIREAAIQNEKHIWDREVRMLREALAPFYKNEQEMRRKLVELEDRVEGNYDEQVRIRDRVMALDDANMTLERRIDEVESKPKRRRITRQVLSDDTSSDTRRPSSNTDERSLRTPSSRALSPNGPFPATTEAEEPRSSGILNLVEMSRSTPIEIPPRVSPTQEEARSSGFLALDLAERLAARKADGNPTPPSSVHSIIQSVGVKYRTPSVHGTSDSDIFHGSNSPSFGNNGSSTSIKDGNFVDKTSVSPGSTSPRKRKHHAEHTALDLLADVTVASPPIH